MIEDWINQHIDATIKYTGSGREIHFDCPVCGETRSRMYVNLNKGLVYCHNCGFNGTMINLIQWVEGISYSKAMNRFMLIKGNISLPSSVGDSIEHRLLILNNNKELPKRAISLPEEYRKITGSNNLVAKRARAYLHRRMVTDTQIKKFEIGFCSSGEYTNRIIIPIKECGELRFWVARAIGDAKLKEKSPSNEDYQISKSEVVFNLDKAAIHYHSAVISEGIFDALSWGDIGISLLGKRLYDEQLNLLLEYRTLLSDGLYIAVDADARSNATEMADRLSSFFEVKFINIPKEFDDPNKYRQTHKYKDMLRLIAKAEPYSEFSNIRRKFT